MQDRGYMVDASKFNLLEDDVHFIDQFWSCYFDWLLQSQQLLTAKCRINCSTRLEQLIVDDSYPIPSKTQHNLSRRQSWHCGEMLSYTMLAPLSFSHIIVEVDPLFVSSYHSLQKCFVFISFQQSQNFFCSQPFLIGSKPFDD